MTADELRELAQKIDEKWWRWKDNPTIELKAAAYLRACADALDAGPVAYKYSDVGIRLFYWADEDGESCKDDELCHPLYPIAVPAPLRMPEPMTDAEFLGHLSLNPPTPSLWQHLKADAVVADVQSSVLAIARDIEAVTLRRVKEANE